MFQTCNKNWLHETLPIYNTKHGCDIYVLKKEKDFVRDNATIVARTQPYKATMMNVFFWENTEVCQKLNFRVLYDCITFFTVVMESKNRLKRIRSGPCSLRHSTNFPSWNWFLQTHFSCLRVVRKQKNR